MYNHEPSNYRCPLCYLIKAVEGDFPQSKQADIFYQDQWVTGFIASSWWPNNPGHVIVIPNEHIENLYDMPDDVLAKVNSLSRDVAIALKKTYGCEGVSTRQHNEPVGQQEVWHFHLHVFPRYENDQLYLCSGKKKLSDPQERAVYAEKLRTYFRSQTSGK